MRKEVEAVIQEEGWSKASVSKLRKLDSFIKESLRLSPLDAGMFSAQTSYVAYLFRLLSGYATQNVEGLHVLGWHDNSCW